VTIVYRRTRTEMPAARDEVEAAEAEGVAIAERLAPLRAIRGAGGRVEAIECAVTEPGAPDASGRRRPVPVPGATRRVPATAVIAAVGQQRGRGVPRADAALAAGEGGVVTGGDALRGPSMIVQAVADARAFARSVADRFGLADEAAPAPAPPIDVNEQLARRSRRIFARTDAREEAARCLGCDALCALCVTVCPNRANVLYEVVPAPGGPAQRFQTANVADWCNACGNCEAFCPTGGAPYRDKPRICLSDAAEREIADGAVFRFAPGGWEMSEKRGGEAVRIVRSGDPAPGDAEGARLRAIGAALAGGLGYLAVVAR
jgi:putative selenate reductase